MNIGFTQKAQNSLEKAVRVASEMGVCHQHYNRIENGVIGKDIQFRTIYALSVVLDIPFNVICEKEVEYQRLLVSSDDD